VISTAARPKIPTADQAPCRFPCQDGATSSMAKAREKEFAMVCVVRKRTYDSNVRKPTIFVEPKL
jgi:hypothetical protein